MITQIDPTDRGVGAGIDQLVRLAVDVEQVQERRLELLRRDHRAAAEQVDVQVTLERDVLRDEDGHRRRELLGEPHASLHRGEWKRFRGESWCTGTVITRFPRS